MIKLTEMMSTQNRNILKYSSLYIEKAFGIRSGQVNF